MQRWIFRSQISSLHCYMIRNQSNRLNWCSRNISYYYQYWKQLCCLIFMWKNIIFSLHFKEDIRCRFSTCWCDSLESSWKFYNILWLRFLNGSVKQHPHFYLVKNSSVNVQCKCCLDCYYRAWPPTLVYLSWSLTSAAVRYRHTHIYTSKNYLNLFLKCCVWFCVSVAEVGWSSGDSGTHLRGQGHLQSGPVWQRYRLLFYSLFMRPALY